MIKYLCLFFIIPFVALGQENEFGKISNDTLYLYNGAAYYPGVKLKVGTAIGTRKTSSFRYIYGNPYTANQNLEKQWGNKEYVIIDVKYLYEKAVGGVLYLKFKRGWDTYWVDIVAAIDNGEVNSEFGKNVSKGKPAISVADELLKLKKLMDDGVLTKEEFEAQKKKLLNQ